MNRFGRRFPSGRGKDPRRPRRPARAPSPRRRAPREFSPLAMIRIASVREKNPTSEHLKEDVMRHQREDRPLAALKSALALISEEVQYYHHWRRAYSVRVAKAVRILEEKHDLLRKKMVLGLSERQTAQKRIFWEEIRKGNDLLRESNDKVSWGEGQMRRVERVIRMCGENETPHTKKTAWGEMRTLNKDGYFHALMGGIHE